MRHKDDRAPDSAEKAVRDIRRATRRRFSAEDKIRIVLEGLRGSTAASTGAAITPRNVKGWSLAPSAAFTVAGPSSALLSTASAVLLLSEAFDFRGRLTYRPMCREERISLTLGQRLNLRVGTPQIAATITGSVLLSETGKGLPS